MEDHFDREIKQKLEGITPEALGYKPDREKLWQQVSGKKKTRSLPFPAWITHAAAIAAGLVIGAYFFSREKGPEPTPAPLAHTSTVTLPAAKATVDTVYVTRQVAIAQPATSGPVTQPVKQNAGIPVKETPIAKEQPGTVPVVVPSPAPQEPLVAIAPPVQQRKVMHLSDMGNENAIAKPKTTEDMAFFNIFSNQDVSQGSQTTLSMLVGQQFGPAKN